MTTERDDRQHPLPSVQCSLCGIAVPIGLMVPDGGQACADVRWYCQDAKSCTERWTAKLPGHPRIAPTPASLVSLTSSAPLREGPPGAGNRRTRPDPVPAELLSSPPEEAWSVDPS